MVQKKMRQRQRLLNNMLDRHFVHLHKVWDTSAMTVATLLQKLHQSCIFETHTLTMEHAACCVKASKATERHKRLTAK